MSEYTRQDAGFYEELTHLLNRYSRENASNTPDYILADYLIECLDSFNKITRMRESWYGRDPSVFPALARVLADDDVSRA